jgi:uncharacterized damage-inducible protein DinB
MLEFVIRQLKHYKDLGDRTFAQISEEDFHYRPYEEVNSIAIIIQHLHGNMLSRWTHFLTEDGEKDWRKRDEEFAVKKLNARELKELWEEGWNLLFQVLGELTEDQLKLTVKIRKESMTAEDAVIRQLSHYTYHIGQIVHIGKIVKAGEWKSLSIPKGESEAYNFKKFEEIEREKHFMDDWLESSK